MVVVRREGGLQMGHGGILCLPGGGGERRSEGVRSDVRCGVTDGAWYRGTGRDVGGDRIVGLGGTVTGVDGMEEVVGWIRPLGDDLQRLPSIEKATPSEMAGRNDGWKKANGTPTTKEKTITAVKI